MPTVIRADGLTNQFSLSATSPPVELTFVEGRAECDEGTAERLAPFMAQNDFSFADAQAPEPEAPSPVEELPAAAPEVAAPKKAPAVKKAAPAAKAAAPKKGK